MKNNTHLSIRFLATVAAMALVAACSEPASNTGGGSSSSSGGTDTGSGTDTAGVSDSGSGGDTATGSDSGSIADSGTVADTATAADTGSVADAGAASDTGSATDSGSAADTAAGADAGGDAGSGSEITQVGPVAGNGCADGTREGFIDDKEFPKIAACGGAWDVKGIHHGKPKCNREAGNDGKNKLGKGCNVEDLCADGWRVCYGKADVLSRNPEGCSRIMEGVKEPGFFLARTSSTGAFNCSQDSTKFGDPGTVNDLFGCGNLGCGTSQGSCTGNKKGCDPAADCSGCAQGQKCADKTTCKPSVCFPLNRASHDLCKTLKKMKNCNCTFTDPAKTKVKCSPSSGGCGWCKPVNYYEKLMNKTFPAAWDCGTSGSKEAVNVVKKNVALGGVLCCRL